MKEAVPADRLLKPRALNQGSFAAFGKVIEKAGANSFPINNGTTIRYDDLARAEAGDGEVVISIFEGQPFALPVTISMMERHPLGSQAFIPVQDLPWLIVVAEDENGIPGEPHAFMARGDQGIQYGRNVWHHPLIALKRMSNFVVVDRRGDGNNLQEINYGEPYFLTL